jgi:hypothetical protein
MIKISKLIGIIHLLAMVVSNIYGFIFNKNLFFDKLYIISFLLIPFSWIIFNDECFISYLIKKLNNPNYILGTKPHDIQDITDLFTNKNYYMIFYNINNILRVLSVIIVCTRSFYINQYLLISTLILYLYYNYDITLEINSRKHIYPYFHIIFSILILIILWIII